MRFTIARLMTIGAGALGITLLMASSLVPVRVSATAEDQFDAAGTYKTKCQACHGATAEKRFDKTKADNQLLDAVMKGVKLEKPPNMPAFEDKGMTADQAKALVDYMKSIKQ